MTYTFFVRKGGSRTYRSITIPQYRPVPDAFQLTCRARARPAYSLCLSIPALWCSLVAQSPGRDHQDRVQFYFSNRGVLAQQTRTYVRLWSYATSLRSGVGNTAECLIEENARSSARCGWALANATIVAIRGAAEAIPRSSAARGASLQLPDQPHPSYMSLTETVRPCSTLWGSGSSRVDTSADVELSQLRELLAERLFEMSSRLSISSESERSLAREPLQGLETAASGWMARR
ncbi:hypothetical protein L227DRAFT_62339 [Lentinus tigrinus ALCF2SS1-6]|uniref:Uncharacterized protein n=1 Tax=Lentinus tigrinus ALCF2SS1-6 TaxID=1328759 RepID=A0A5C2RLZ3_9APHY|nr:hypothetical protein L227DRAFT_62339 [Lentinus tigrinus ALCF2SS1-6]